MTGGYGMGDASIKALTDRVDRLVREGVGGGSDTETRFGNYDITANGWARISEQGLLRGSPPSGAEILVETDGNIQWGSQPGFRSNLSFGCMIGLTLQGHAEVKIEYQSWTGSLPLAFSCRCRFSVRAAGQIDCHTHVSISPQYPNLIFTRPQSDENTGTTNTLTGEGHAVAVGYAPAISPVPLAVAAAWDAAQAGGGGKRILTHSTRITWSGGAR